MNRQLTLFLVWMGCSLVVTGVACGQQEASSTVPTRDAPVHSYLAGRLTVNADVDSVQDYRGFEVLVALDNQGQPDTLGYDVTDSTGAFQLDVTAPTRGIYALIISRRGQILKVGELAVSEGDSATLDATFPMGNRRLRIRSEENAAWVAYQNTKLQHNNSLLALVQSGEYAEGSARARVEQTTMIFWNMRSTFPGTMGGEVAAAEAVMMLSGWNDSLALARAYEITPKNINYADVGRAARQAQARLAGQEAALQLVRDFQERALDDKQRAQLHSEIVLAHMDSLEYDEALDEARALATTYAGASWARWADRAIYELENLLPGMAAPAFAVRTSEGDSVALGDLRGRLVLLEFYQPQDQVYQREFEVRNALYEAVGGDSLHIVSISVEPDTLLNEAFLDGRAAPGFHVFAPEGLENMIARRYNVNVLPTRYLIDSDGNIVGKYVGGTMATLREDILALLRNS